MTTVFDVPAKAFIDATAKKLEDNKTVTLPEWSAFVRTGVHTQNPPEEKNWWYIRCAAILRKIYMHERIGIERLRAEFGGYQNRGSKPNKAQRGSGTIIRVALQQLEKAGYLSKVKGKGRMVTPKGRAFMDATAHEVMQHLEKQIPALSKY